MIGRTNRGKPQLFNTPINTLPPNGTFRAVELAALPVGCLCLLASLPMVLGECSLAGTCLLSLM